MLANLASKEIGLENVILDYGVDKRIEFQHLYRRLESINSQDALLLLDSYNNYKPQRNSEVPLLHYVQKDGNNYHLLSSEGEYKFIGMVRKFVPIAHNKACSDYILKNVNLIAVGGVVQSADNEIMVMMRGKKVDVPGKLIPSPAGNMEYSEEFGRMPTLEEELFMESAEEVDLEADTFVDIKPVAIVKGLKESYNPVVTYSMRSSLPTHKIRERFEEAIKNNQYEDREMTPVKADEKIVINYILDNADRLVDNGVGMIVHWGQYFFGNKWYEEVKKSIEEKFQFVPVRDFLR